MNTRISVEQKIFQPKQTWKSCNYLNKIENDLKLDWIEKNQYITLICISVLRKSVKITWIK